MWQELKRILLGSTSTSFSPEVMARKIEELKFKRQKNHVVGQQIYYWLRNFWGVLLALVLVASVAFQFYLTWMIGKGEWNFKEYEQFLSVVTGGNFVQVVGLCIIVVNYLFPKGKNGG